MLPRLTCMRTLEINTLGFEFLTVADLLAYSG